MASDIKLRITAKDKTKRAFKSVQTSLAGMAGRVASVTTGIGALVGVGGIGLLIKRSIDTADQIDKLSIRLGASTEALSQYRHVARLSGIQFETLTMGLQRMTRRVAEAAQGTGEAQGALQELNLDARQLAMLRPEQQFEILADALAGVKSESDRVRLAMKLFDSEGVSLLQTMEDGSAGIRAMREEADKLGLTLSEDVAKQAADFNDSLRRLQSRFEGLANAVLPSFFDELADITEYVTNDVLPAFRLLAERLGIIDVAIEDMTEDEKLARMGLLSEKMREIQERMQVQAETSPNTAINEQDIKLLRVYGEEYGKLQASVTAGQATDPAGQPAPAAPGVALVGGAAERKNVFTGTTNEQLQEDKETALTAFDEYHDAHATLYDGIQQRALEAADIEIRARMNVAQQAVALLQAFAGKSKAAAIAAIALSKGVQIAQTVMSTETAAMQARTALIVPGDPSSVARAEAAAARIRALGRVSVGLIAATGLAQASQVGGGSGGGAAIGTPGNPIQTTDADPVNTAAQGDAGTQGTINIIVNGVLTDDIVDQVLVPRITSAVEDRDVILISNNSRNAQELITR